MTNPDIREGDDDNERWHRGVGVENDLFNGHYRENPQFHSLPASHKPMAPPITSVISTPIIVSIIQPLLTMESVPSENR